MVKAGNFREHLKWIFRAFFVGVGFWERRNGHLRAAAGLSQPAARPGFKKVIFDHLVP